MGSCSLLMHASPLPCHVYMCIPCLCFRDSHLVAASPVEHCTSASCLIPCMLYAHYIRVHGELIGIGSSLPYLGVKDSHRGISCAAQQVPPLYRI